MKKLQIMAGMLSVLLLVGCGGTGVSAKTAGEDPPQTTSADASGTTAAQNGNENPSEVVTQDEAERPALSMRSRREKRKPIPLPEKRSLRRKFLRCKCCLPRLCRLKLRPQDPPPLNP